MPQAKGVLIMTFGYAVQSAFEILLFIAIVFGLIFENRIACWEQRIFKKISSKICRRKKIVRFDCRQNSDRAV